MRECIGIMAVARPCKQRTTLPFPPSPANPSLARSPFPSSPPHIIYLSNTDIRLASTCHLLPPGATSPCLPVCLYCATRRHNSQLHLPPPAGDRPCRFPASTPAPQLSPTNQPISNPPHTRRHPPQSAHHPDQARGHELVRRPRGGERAVPWGGRRRHVRSINIRLNKMCCALHSASAWSRSADDYRV